MRENYSKPWNIRYVSRNPNITIDIIKNNLNFKWDWEDLSENTVINWADIK